MSPTVFKAFKSDNLTFLEFNDGTFATLDDDFAMVELSEKDYLFQLKFESKNSCISRINMDAWDVLSV